MSTLQNNNLLKILKDFERIFNIVQVFKFKDTTVWVDIKNYIYTKSLNGVVEMATDNKKAFLNFIGFKLTLISILHYIEKIFIREKQILYIGAGSGLFEFENNILDSYLPKELENKKVIYMLSAEYPDKLIKYKTYIKKHKIIIFSFLIAPLKIIFTKLIYRFINVKVENVFFNTLNENNNSITQKEINLIYSKFIVTYYLYKIFLMFFKIEKAYIVSSYSNTELVSVLKEKGIEILELQHGVIGSIHIGYNYATKDKLLPTPHKVYVYNSFWKKELLQAGYYNKNQIIISGRLKYDLVKTDIEIYSNRYLVFTGQGGFYNEISNLCKDAEVFLEKNSIKLIYLPHPNESDTDIESLENLLSSDSIIVLKEKHYTTEQYVYNSLAHISVYSSCHFDAVHYKNKTYIFDIMDDNPMNYYSSQFKDIFINIKKIEEININE